MCLLENRSGIIKHFRIWCYKKIIPIRVVTVTHGLFSYYSTLNCVNSLLITLQDNLLCHFFFFDSHKMCPELRLVSCQCPCPLPVIHLNHRTTFPTIHNLPPCQVINTKPYSDSKFYLSHTVHNYIHYITCCIMKRPISWMITRLLSHFSTCLNHNCKF